MHKRIILLLILFSTVLFAQEQIDVKKLHEHVSYLASDELKGRKPGTKEGRMAADYIANHFKDLGFKPLGDNGFQYFKVTTKVKLVEGNKLTLNDKNFTVKEDYIPVGFSESAALKAEVIFAGYGFKIKNDSTDWDDYKDVNVDGKWVLILRGDPENAPHGGKFWSHSALRKKAMVAKDAGAAGVLIVSGNGFDDEDKLMRLRFDQSKSTSGIPVINIKKEVANQLLANAGKDVDALEAKLNKEQKGLSFNTKMVLDGQVAVEQEKVTTQNVLAVHPGTDESQKDNYIIIGAHYDHLGFGGQGSGSRKPDTVAVHNGADDNASGVATILELARYYSDKKHKRPILFMAFGAEEMGLLGSKFFTKNALVDLEKVRIMFNFDMVGRLRQESKALTVGGTGTAKGLEAFIKKEAEDHPLKIKASSEGFGPSDHASFYVEDLPVLFFFTGTHDDYHKPEDDTEKINFAGMKMIATYGIDLIDYQINSEDPLEFTKAGEKKEQRRMRFRVTLGVVPDYASDIKGMAIDGVKKGGPAEKGGLKKGDVIVSMAGKPVGNIYDYMGRLGTLKKGQKIVIEVMRDGKKVALNVTL